MHFTQSGSVFNGFYTHCTGTCCASENRSREVSASDESKIAKSRSGRKAEVEKSFHPSLLIKDKEEFVPSCTKTNNASRQTEAFWTAWRRKNFDFKRPLSEIRTEAHELAWLSASYLIPIRLKLIEYNALPSSARKEDPFSETKTQIERCILKTRMQTPVIHGALVLLQRACGRMQHCTLPFPDTSNFGMFVCVCIISHGFLMDETYSMSSWAQASKNEFSVKDINEAVLKMLAVMKWKVTITSKDLSAMSRELERWKH